MSETHRFETLMQYFDNPESFQIEFMVACMQFINIVVHSVEDMNFRVALQWEFSALGLDDCLERLRNNESEELSVQISAYLDNEFDVSALMEEADTKNAALERVHELEEELGRLNELLQELEVSFFFVLLPITSGSKATRLTNFLLSISERSHVQASRT